jgi:hypothetical protein
VENATSAESASNQCAGRGDRGGLTARRRGYRGEAARRTQKNNPTVRPAVTAAAATVGHVQVFHSAQDGARHSVDRGRFHAPTSIVPRFDGNKKVAHFYSARLSVDAGHRPSVLCIRLDLQRTDTQFHATNTLLRTILARAGAHSTRHNSPVLILNELPPRATM